MTIRRPVRPDLFRPSRRDAIVSLASLPGLLALTRCARTAKLPTEIPGEIVGGDASLGHRLRDGRLGARPVVRRETVGTAILGGGISGLAAGWTLARAGDRDYRIYELEGVPGGTARSGESPVSRYPWGAHYVPTPLTPNPALEAVLEEAGAVDGRDEGGRPIWAEEVLCGDPEERLFVAGQWHEGLYPRAGASRRDLDELLRYERAMRAFAGLRDESGRRAFDLPTRRSSTSLSTVELDTISMADWLTREGFTSPRLRWLVEYGCRDDFGSSLAETSAWAGVHYVAARLRGEREDEEPAPFLTWPEGNGRLVTTLLAPSRDRVTTDALVHAVTHTEAGVVVRYLDRRRDEVVEVTAKDAVFALPKFLLPHLVTPRPEALPTLAYAPWLVANVTVSARPLERGFPMAWDNVLYDSTSLGYVLATHQAGPSRGPTVLTYYRPFAGEDARGARERLLGATHADLAASVVAELSRAHHDLPSLVTRVDVYRWGHAMARPAPGTLLGEARRALRAPIGRLRLAHADTAGLPLFEEALDSGVRAAEDILRSRGVPFRELST